MYGLVWLFYLADVIFRLLISGKSTGNQINPQPRTPSRVANCVARVNQITYLVNQLVAGRGLRRTYKSNRRLQELEISSDPAPKVTQSG
jgi:hypothetical protein